MNPPDRRSPEGPTSPEATSVVRETVDRVQEISAIRERHESGLRRADWVSAAVLGWGFMGLALALALFGGSLPSHELQTFWPWVGLVALYALAHDTVFVAATGSAVPTQPILVAMLFTMPVHVVPLALLVGVLLGGALEPQSGSRLYRLSVDASAAWHCAGPVAVLMIADVSTTSFSHWPVYLLALVSQFAVDAVVGSIRTLALGSSIRGLAAPMIWTFGVDTMLAPIGLTAAMAAGSSPALLILLAAPLGLMRLLAADRTAHLEQAITLGSAYAEVSTQARVDSMTGVANRRGWEEAVNTAQEALLAGTVRQVDVVMADLDHLKLTNDTFGHQAGDELIRKAANVLTHAVPSGAFVARLGGDEFGVLITDGSVDAGERVLDAIRAAVSEHHKPGQPFSISLGAAGCPPCDSVREAVEVADTASAVDKAARRAGRSDTAPAPRPLHTVK